MWQNPVFRRGVRVLERTLLVLQTIKKILFSAMLTTIVRAQQQRIECQIDVF